MANLPPPSAPEEEAGHPAFSRLSILRTIWKRRVRIASAFVLLAAATVVIVHSLPSVYLAESVVLIDSQKIPEKFVEATVGANLEERIASIRQQILAGSELKKIIDDFNLYPEERKTHVQEEILDMMRKDISITLDNAGLATSSGSSSRSRDQRPPAFRIGFQGRDPALVARVANRLTDMYVDQNLKTRESEASGTSEFLETQLREAKTRLDQMEATVSKYKIEHNGELPEQEHSLTAALARLQVELESNRDAVNRAQQTRVILESNLNGVDATLAAEMRAWQQVQQRSSDGDSAALLPDFPNVAPQKKTSDMLKDQLAQLRGKYTDNHPEVVRLRAAIARIEHIEQGRDVQGSATPSDSAKAGAAVKGTGTAAQVVMREPPEIARAREQVNNLKAQILGTDQELQNRKAEQQRILREMDSYQRRVEHLPISEQEMAQITRDYGIAKDNYKSLLDKKMAAAMSLDMERRQQSERFIILDRAQVPDKPIKPKRPMLYGGGLAASLALALLLGFGAELKKNVVLGEWELPPGTPVLARLPYIEVSLDATEAAPKVESWFSRRRKLAIGSAIVLLIVGGAAAGFLAFLNRL